MIYSYQHGGQTYTVRLERTPDGGYVATIDERTFPVDAQPLKDGDWLLTLSGQRITVYGAAAGNQRYMHLGGQSYTLSVPDARSKRRSSTAAVGDLTAQMPGQVVDILVSEGEAVNAGQTLMLLEAMKMQIRVSAPQEGRVKRLLVGKGMVVERGQLLAEIEA
ncbi:MAG: biotin/lipoyl-containing protein [Chloroflexota bacterium]